MGLGHGLWRPQEAQVVTLRQQRFKQKKKTTTGGELALFAKMLTFQQRPEGNGKPCSSLNEGILGRDNSKYEDPEEASGDVL